MAQKQSIYVWILHTFISSVYISQINPFNEIINY